VFASAVDGLAHEFGSSFAQQILNMISMDAVLITRPVYHADDWQGNRHTAWMNAANVEAGKWENVRRSPPQRRCACTNTITQWHWSTIWPPDLYEPGTSGTNP
jgi:hypothetical protein